jgi:plastocyanin
MRTTRWFVVSSVALVLAIGGVACSSDDGGGGGGGGDGGGAKADLVAKDFEFDPSTVTANADGTLTITNEGSVEHSFTMDDDSVSEDIQPGDTITVTLSAGGGFHCKYHPTQMTGTVSLAS